MEAGFLTLLGASIAGAVVSGVLGCLPALHIYNVAGVLVLSYGWLEGLGVPVEVISCFMMGLVAGYSMVNTIPAIFLGAPDESTVFITLPGQKFLMSGRGPEATYLTAIGGLGGFVFLALAIPLGAPILAGLRQILSRHMFWILGLILAFMVLSEWPKGGGRGKDPLIRLWRGMRSVLAGHLTLILSGLLGFIILYRPLIPLQSAFQNIMPAFVGLFAVPWVLQNMVSATEIPTQRFPRTLDVKPSLLLRGVGAEGKAAIDVPFTYSYDGVTSVDIFNGPSFSFRPNRHGEGIEVDFLAWHRRWSHSLTLAAFFGLVVAFLLGPLAGLVAATAYTVHVLEDQLGMMGSNLLWPLTRTRMKGLGIMRSGDALPNFAFVWLSVVTIIFNLNRFHDTPVFSQNPLVFFGLAFVLPMALLVIAGRLVTRLETRTGKKSAFEDDAFSEMGETF